MKKFRVYKVNQRALIWGLDLSMFYIFMLVVGICSIILVINISVIKVFILGGSVGLSYVGLKFFSTMVNTNASLFNEKLPKRIKNMLP